MKNEKTEIIRTPAAVRDLVREIIGQQKEGFVKEIMSQGSDTDAELDHYTEMMSSFYYVVKKFFDLEINENEKNPEDFDLLFGFVETVVAEWWHESLLEKCQEDIECLQPNIEDLLISQTK